jgi:hypothetical protein
VITASTGATYAMLGVMSATDAVTAYAGTSANSCGYYPQDGSLWANGAAVLAAGTMPTATVGDVICFAFDSSTGKLWIGKNGVWFQSGSPTAGSGSQATLSVAVYPAISLYNNGDIVTAAFTGGFANTVPTTFASF